MLQLIKGSKERDENKPGFNNSKQQASSSYSSWVQKYVPLSVKQLVIHSTTTRSITQWIEEALTTTNNNHDNNNLIYSYKTPVLILCGKSGCGKSTAIELICNELKVDIKHWTEDSWETSASKSYTVNNNKNYTNSDGLTHSSKVCILYRIIHYYATRLMLIILHRMRVWRSSHYTVHTLHYHSARHLSLTITQ